MILNILEEIHVEAGQATFIPAGQEHFCYNASDEECEIVWVLIG